MRKIFACLALGAMLLAFGPSGQAQQPKKIARVAYLAPATRAAGAETLEAFRQGMRELGHVEGKTYVLEIRFAEAKAERLPELARELVGLRMDVIVAVTDVAIAAVKRETQTIPIVMANSTDPVGTGFVASLARPGGNVTGLSLMSPELSGKRLGLLREIVPGLFRVAFIWNPNVRGAVFEYKETESAARSLRLQLQSIELVRTDDLDHAFSAITKERAQALNIAAQNPAAFSNRGEIASLAQRNRLPAIYGQALYVEAGGLISYGPSDVDMRRQSATYVDKILKGAKPGELPVEQPSKFELVINLKAARQIGVTIPPNVLARADRVIK